MNKDFVVVDLETLGKWDSAVVLSAGVVFGSYGTPQTIESFIERGLYAEFDVKEQLAKQRTMCADVIDWWGTVKTGAESVLGPDHVKMSLYDFPALCKSFLEDNGVDLKNCDLYDRNSFDMTKLEHVIKNDMCQAKVFWNYGNVLELSTALKFLGFDRYGNLKAGDVPNITYHNALHDAALDAYRLQHCLSAVLNPVV